MTCDLNILFETEVRTSKYDSTKEELEAVAAGTKALSFFLFPSSSVESHPFYMELRQIAFALNLSIVINPVNETDPDPRRRVANVFLTRPMELWRVPAYSAFKSVFQNYDWSDAAEHFESVLLGYSDEDISKWLNAHASSQISWKGSTVYLLLSSTQASGVRTLSKRCVDPSLILEPIRVFFDRERNPVRKNAADFLPDKYVLARVSVHHSFFREFFGRQTLPSESDVITSLLTAELAPKMNSALESNFQFFEAGVWK